MIKDTPTTYHDYYKSMKDRTSRKKDEAQNVLDDLRTKEFGLYNKVKEDTEGVAALGIYLSNYKEFEENKYIDGKFYKDVNSKLIKGSDNVWLTTRKVNLLSLVKTQKEIYELENQIKYYDILLNLSLKEYSKIVEKFYTEVHKKLILEGNGYVFEGKLGWICVNRCHLVNKAPKLNSMATKKRKEQLLSEGKRLYNKEEAEWCEANGIKYDGVDYRVWLDSEYCYEIPLIGCKLENGTKFKFTTSDYRNYKLRGKSNEQLIEECNNNPSEICDLKVDVRTKLNMCLKADNGLYLKYIRNEGQKSLSYGKTDRKDRQ